MAGRILVFSAASMGKTTLGKGLAERLEILASKGIE